MWRSVTVGYLFRFGRISPSLPAMRFGLRLVSFRFFGIAAFSFKFPGLAACTGFLPRMAYPAAAQIR